MKKIVNVAQGTLLLGGSICAYFLGQHLITKMARKGIYKAIQTIFD